MESNGNTKISLIVPVYQAEEYLARCFDSILNQTYKDFEVIVIDDVRRNNEANICKYLFMIHRKDLINDDPDESENPPYHLSFCDIINDCPTVEDFERHVRGGLATRIIQEFIHG